MKMLIAAAAMLLAPSVAHAQTAATDTGLTVYDKALSPGWENWSWAKTELSVGTAGARMPILVDAQGYGGLFLHHAPFSTAPYRGLHMLMQVVGGEVTVRVMVTVAGKPIPDGDKVEYGQPVMVMKKVTLKPGGWTDVLIPLATLGAENKEIDGIQVMNDSGQQAPHFYVADISFKS
jgi:chitinase